MAAASLSLARHTFLGRTAECVVGLRACPVRHHTGYIPFEGRFGPDRNCLDKKLVDQWRALNLQPVAKIQFTFDPIRADVGSIRHFMLITSYPKVRQTNPRVIYKTSVVSDRSDPVIRVELADGGSQIVFKASRLSILDILYEFNKIMLPLVKDEAAPSAALTKSAKQANTTSAKRGQRR
ncbi:uncharacterized protein LOC131880515 [Tigriopus californicus]|uniref:uncharacterized protein LOC131880515 n=1 Tax=Tigriopus californicus TaxID=6832 RepID=UPI0027DA9A79|nr:uncharacterized protein LOC131880515 [Tigriopus californicus]|eukprot:TCALIF_00049-PA protein Name:"Protein of unknown function" AED:0.35 eAED:0.52 QI:0/-1/0/1/-1/1/1/0/179